MILMSRHEAATQSLLSVAGEDGIEKRWGGPSGGSVKMEEHGCEIASSCLAVLEATRLRNLPQTH